MMLNTTKLINTILILLMLIPITVLANDSNLVTKLNTCMVIKQAVVRLQCFDDLTKTVTDYEYNTEHTISQNSKNENNQIVALLAGSEPVDNQISNLTAKQIDDFSKETVKKTPQQQAAVINTISLTINKLSKSIRGQWQIFFANGQQWQQKDNINLRLKVGDKVQLIKGALGAVFLKKYNTNKRIKVKRLK